MSVEIQRASATIIPFPAGGRRAFAEKRDDAKPVAEMQSPLVTSGAWYHDTAIQESKRASER